MTVRRYIQSSALLAAGALLMGCVAQTSNVRVAGPGSQAPSVPPDGPKSSRAPAAPTPSAPEPAPTAAGAIEALAMADDAPLPLVEPAGDPYAGAPAMVSLGDDPLLATALLSSRQSYEQARRLFRARDIDGAREHFDLAVDAFGEGPLATRADAIALAEAVTVQVAAYEAAWAEVEEIEGDAEPAALDALASVQLPEVATTPEPLSPPLAAVHSQLHGDIPIVINNQVRAMLDIYKGRLKGEIMPAFVRSGRYMATIQEIFREERVPQDLAWLALVESGFKELAYSRASAKGLWQFIRSTGKAYQLDADFWVDDRADPVEATRAAARHLRDLHDTFGDWYLALAAYNAGAGKVGRAIKHVGRNDYWAIASSRWLMPETKNYVPAFLATLLIVENPSRYGFDYTPALPWSYDQVRVESPADLTVIASAAGTSVDEIRRLNPQLRRPVTPANVAHYDLRLPRGTRETFLAAWSQVPPSERLRFTTHSVKKGESLRQIARRYGVSEDSLLAANSLSRGRSVVAGSEVKVPLSDEYFPPANWHDGEARRSSSRRSSTISWYRVRKGETAASVAKRHGISLAELRRLNGMSRSAGLIAGSRIRVPSRATTSKAKVASRERSLRHKVRRGETLTAIASRYGVRVQDLARWNRVNLTASLAAGKTLTVYVAR